MNDLNFALAESEAYKAAQKMREDAELKQLKQDIKAAEMAQREEARGQRIARGAKPVAQPHAIGGGANPFSRALHQAFRSADAGRRPSGSTPSTPGRYPEQQVPLLRPSSAQSQRPPTASIPVDNRQLPPRSNSVITTGAFRPPLADQRAIRRGERRSLLSSLEEGSSGSDAERALYKGKNGKDGKKRR